MHQPRPKQLRWLRLDNAAKIYPASRSKHWSNIYRLSATLSQPVDTQVLTKALEATVPRFPSIAARLRRGLFWYYLQQLEFPPDIREEHTHPLTHMSRSEVRKCAFRVLVYQDRIALEFFHALTDGNGALIFLKSLLAEYLQQKYAVQIPAQAGVLDRQEAPLPEELEDSFLKYGGALHASRKSSDAWQLSGTPEPDFFLHLTCLRMPVEAVAAKAREYHVSVTAFLCAALMMALQHMQQARVPIPRLRKSIKVLIPVDLRRLFPSKTLRNFLMYTVPEIMPRLGWYEFPEICRLVHHRMGLDITPKHMSTMIAANISSERILAVRLIPLFLKNLVMKAIFNSVGERKSCLSLSNLGMVELPAQMQPYVKRFDFILGIQATAPNNCGVISYDGQLYFNMIRNIQEPALEMQLFRVLQELGIPVQVQSNRPEPAVKGERS